MKLLIDGYNLVRYITRGPATKIDIESVLGRLRRYSRFMGHDIIVVFDGGEGMYKYQLTYHGLHLWYSGLRETADDVIKLLLPGYNPDEVLLVSDDRQLNYAAQECGIVSISPAVFYSCMQEKEESSSRNTKEKLSTTFKTSSDSNYELDALMHAESRNLPSKQETSDDKNDILKNKKSSKIERRLQVLMRKL